MKSLLAKSETLTTESSQNISDDLLTQGKFSKRTADELKRILQIPSYNREPEEIDYIAQTTENFAFFQKYLLKPKYSQFDVHRKCCRQMTYEYHSKGATIFKQGAQGDKLYFVLSGRLNSYVYMTKEEIAKQKAAKEQQKTKEAEKQKVIAISAKRAQSIATRKASKSVAISPFRSPPKPKPEPDLNEIQQTVTSGHSSDDEHSADVDMRKLQQAHLKRASTLMRPRNSLKKPPSRDSTNIRASPSPDGHDNEDLPILRPNLDASMQPLLNGSGHLVTIRNSPGIRASPSPDSSDSRKMTVLKLNSNMSTEPDPSKIAPFNKNNRQQSPKKPVKVLRDKNAKEQEEEDNKIQLREFRLSINFALRYVTKYERKLKDETTITEQDESSEYLEGLTDEMLEKKVEEMRLIGTMEAGQIFGDIALTVGRRRLATVIAMEDCHLGVLHKDDFDALLLPLEKKKFKNRIEFFERAFGFAMPWEKVVGLLYLLKKQKFKKSHYMFKENQPSEGFYIVKSGEIFVYKDIEYLQHQEEEGDCTIEEKTGKGDKADESLQMSFVGKKAKYPVQLLTKGDFLGDETILGLKTRAFTAVCKSDVVTVYYIPESKLRTFLWTMKQQSDQLFQRVEQRVLWRVQRLEEREMYIDKVLKGGRNLDSPNRTTPFLQRIFPDDIAKVYALLKKEAPPPEVEEKVTKALKYLHTPYKKSSKSSQNVLRSPIPLNLQSHAWDKGALGDTLSAFQYINKVNEDRLAKWNENDPDPYYDPFAIENGLILDPEEEGVASKKLKVLMKESERRKMDFEMNGRKELPPAGSETLRETAGRVSDKMLMRVAKSSLKMVVGSSREQEEFRQRIARSLSNGKIKSSKKSEKQKKSGLMFMKIHGLEANQEATSKLKTIESFVTAEECKSFRKETEPRDTTDWLRKPKRTNSLQSGMLGARGSVGSMSTKDILAQWQQQSEGSKAKLERSPSLVRATKNKKEEEGLSFLRVLDMISFTGDMQHKSVERKGRNTPERLSTHRQETWESTKETLATIDSRDHKPYGRSMSRKGVQRIVKSGFQLDMRRSTEGAVKPNIEEESEDKSYLEMLGKRKQSEGRVQDYVSTERDLIRQKMDDQRNNGGELSSRTLMKKTKHNLFRVRAKNNYHSPEKDGVRKSLL